MTRIDFHSSVPNKLAYACRLVRKARASGCNIVLFASDARQMAELDDALWTVSEQDFLPHVIAGDPLAARTPIILVQDAQTEVPHHQVLINLSNQTPDYFARFERLIEVVSADTADAQAGRDRYRHYKQRGYPVTHHPADKAEKE
ncbi:MAG: holC [Herminiimonas sp.]|nr:holC [Herminiimonas sp.]